MMATWAVIESGVVVNTVVWDGVSGWSPPEGCEAVEVASGAGIGWTYVDGEFVPPPEPPKTWDDIRGERDRLLAASDWTQVADAPVDAAPWAVYRQALRDIPQDFDSPDDVVWPEAP